LDDIAGVTNSVAASGLSRPDDASVRRAHRRTGRRGSGRPVGIVLGLLWHFSELPALAEFSNFPTHYRFTVVPAAVAAGLSVLAALTGPALPAYRAGRINAIEAIGYE